MSQNPLDGFIDLPFVFLASRDNYGGRTAISIYLSF